MNTRVETDYNIHATVDTAPDSGSDGYFTNGFSIREKKVNEVFFSVRGTGSATVTLQFMSYGDTDWTDYVGEEEIVNGSVLVLKGKGAGFIWRAGVKTADYVSGSVSFGFDW